ncbi:MAG TPA: AMP-binding protein [Acidimicrobiia bacterium]|nr:AMP-binding protein [Acidimicrobiia bacterium]
MVSFNLADLFELVADAVPDRVAVVGGDVRRTYGALDERATRLAHAIDVEPGRHVGLCLRNSIAHVELMLACYKRRVVPVNVNWRYTDDELDYLARDAQLVALWRDEDTGTDAYEDLVASGSPARDFGERSADDHYVLYTGGTTGMPKGVVWRQEDIFFAALGGGNPGGPPITAPGEIVASVLDNPSQRLRAFLRPDEPGPPQFVSLALGPLMHASGQWSALGTLLGGGKVVLVTDTSIDMTRVLDLVEREAVNACNLVGDASARPMLAALAAEPQRWDTSSLRLLGSGGSILSGAVKDELMRALPSVLAIVEGVGSSEAPAQAVAVTRRDGGVNQSLTFAPKAETIVVDDDLRPIPAGSGRAGRLATRGRVPLHYYNDPERSARTFVEIDGRRWSLPGDMATIDADGTIHLLGRGSLCINTGGEKVYPEEVEAVLKTAPGVADAAVLGVADDVYGERVVALVAPADRATPPTLDDVQQYARTRLAGYKLPRALHVVDDIVRTPAGKIDYAWARSVATVS